MAFRSAWIPIHSVTSASDSTSDSDATSTHGVSYWPPPLACPLGGEYPRQQRREGVAIHLSQVQRAPRDAGRYRHQRWHDASFDARRVVN
jgi:hypothetical protein